MEFDYKLLKALEAVVLTQSFERAAQMLFLTQSAVSQRIKQLESQQGEPLLVRSQPLEATPRGQKLLGHYQRVRQIEKELEQQLGGQEGSLQPVPLAVNADTLATWLFSALAQLLEQEQIQLHLIVDDESRTWERMRKGEVLASITSQAKPTTGAQSIYLGEMEYLCVASPSFSQRYFPNGLNRESLRKAPTTAYDLRDDMHLKFLNRNFGLVAGEYHCHTVRSSDAFVKMAKLGQVYSLVARHQVINELESGELINLTPAIEYNIPLYWHRWQLGGELMARLTQQVSSYCKKALLQSDPS
jgi:LysR family transcriptional regulator (chromosome initiation inhibitor)